MMPALEDLLPCCYNGLWCYTEPLARRSDTIYLFRVTTTLMPSSSQYRGRMYRTVLTVRIHTFDTTQLSF